MKRVTGTDLLLAHFMQAARPLFRHLLQKNACIAASKITAECLGYFGLTADVRPMKFILRAESLQLAFCVGLTDAERSTAKSSEYIPCDDSDPWNGHTVVIAYSPIDERRYLIDASFGQASLPDRGLEIKQNILILPLDDFIPATDDLLHVTAELQLDNGLVIEVDYLPLDDMTFKESEAWQDEDTALVAAMITEMIIKGADNP